MSEKKQLGTYRSVKDQEMNSGLIFVKKKKIEEAEFASTSIPLLTKSRVRKTYKSKPQIQLEDSRTVR